MTFSDSWKEMSGHPWGVWWRAGLAKLPRLAPTEALRITNPLGPYPHIIHLPSRDPKRTIPCHTFIPHSVQQDFSQKPPVIVDFHGGGFFLGTCLEEAPFCGKLARDLAAVVLTVDYRMGPINKHPAALEDAEDVMHAILDPHARGYQELRRDVTAAILKRRLERHEKEAKQHEKDNAKQPEPQRTTSREGHHISFHLRHHRKAQEPEHFDFDVTRVGVAGASSGGNMALNMALEVDKPLVEEKWRCVFPKDYKHPIAFLLYFPSFDCRLLPSERPRPEKLPVSKGVWADMNDMLMPTYLPRELAGHPRASPGLASIKDGLHPQARMQLVLCGLDNLSEQSEVWVKKVEVEGRFQDMIVHRYPERNHGWSHIPEMALKEDERRERNDALDKSVKFCRDVWEGRPVKD